MVVRVVDHRHVGRRGERAVERVQSYRVNGEVGLATLRAVILPGRPHARHQQERCAECYAGQS